MNWLDVLLLLPLLVGLVRGLMRGFISEVIAIVVVVLGAVGARFAAPPFSAWLLAHNADWPQGVCDVVAYTLVFLLIAVLLSIAARKLNKSLHKIHLGWANRLLGGLFGLCKYGVIVLVVVFAMDRTNDAYHWLDDAPVVQSSRVYPVMVHITDDLLSFSGQQPG